MLNSIHGRVPELGTINRCLRELKAGHGRFVLVEGAAGLGKSRLLHEAARSARQRGIAVASGRDRHQKDVGLTNLLDRLAIRVAPVKRVRLDAGDRVSVREIAHRTGDVRKGAAESGNEVPGAIAEAEDEEPHSSSVLVEVKIAPPL